MFTGNIVSAILVVSLLYLNTVPAFGENHQPACSRFHYEEQLLEKMIRMEIKFEALLDSVRKFEADVKSELDATIKERKAKREEFVQLKTDIGDFQKTLVAGINEFKTGQKEQFNDLPADWVELLNKSFKESVHRSTVVFEAVVATSESPVKGDVIKFSKTRLNTGGGYSNSTGIFTSPQDGVYLIMVQFCLFSSKIFYFDIMVNNKIHNAVEFSSDGKYQCSSTQSVIKLNVDDTVWLQCNIRKDVIKTLHNGRHHVNTFSGILVG